MPRKKKEPVTVIKLSLANKLKYDPHNHIHPTRFPVYDKDGNDINPFTNYKGRIKIVYV